MMRSLSKPMPFGVGVTIALPAVLVGVAVVKSSSVPLVILSMGCIAACWHGRGLLRVSRVGDRVAVV